MLHRAVERPEDEVDMKYFGSMKGRLVTGTRARVCGDTLK